MLSGFWHTRFGVLFCSVVLGCRYTPYTTGPCSQWCQFLNWHHWVPVGWGWGGVFECDHAHYRSVAVCSCTGSGVFRCTLFMVLYLSRVCRCVVHALLDRTSVHYMSLLAAERRSTIGLLFSSQYPCGTILVTPYSMLCYWRVPRAGPTPFYWPSY